MIIGAHSIVYSTDAEAGRGRTVVITANDRGASVAHCLRYCEPRYGRSLSDFTVQGTRQIDSCSLFVMLMTHARFARKA